MVQHITDAELIMSFNQMEQSFTFRSNARAEKKEKETLNYDGSFFFEAKQEGFEPLLRDFIAKKKRTMVRYKRS